MTQTPNISSAFKQSLCQVIESSLLFDHQTTFNLLKQANICQEFFNQAFDQSFLHRTEYERKLFIFSFSKLLFQHQDPFLSQHSALILKHLILMLIRQQRLEHKKS